MNQKWCHRALLVLMTLGILSIPPRPSFAQYHTGDTLVCYNCHTMHFSQTQGKSPDDPYGTGSNIQYPLVPPGPHPYLLNAPQNSICLSCHDGNASAPDVSGANSNASPNEGRQAGALTTGSAPYDSWKGHTLGATDSPPGYNPNLVGLGSWYTGTTYGLKCIHCHEYHANAGSYRDLGPNALGATAGNFRPGFVVSPTNDTTKDVWIKIDPATYTAGSGSAALFNPYYSAANINFNRIDDTVGSLKNSNKMGSFCATFHADLHGGPGNINIGASPGVLDGFLRHPTAQVTIGSSTFSDHSSLTLFQGKANKVKVFTTDYSSYYNAVPGCVSCHKAHGNKNPFALIYMGDTGVIGEEGTMTSDPRAGIQALCGQCHAPN